MIKMNSVPVDVIEISSSSESDSGHSVVEMFSSSENDSAGLDAEMLQRLDYKVAIRDAVHELASVGRSSPMANLTAAVTLKSASAA